MRLGFGAMCFVCFFFCTLFASSLLEKSKAHARTVVRVHVSRGLADSRHVGWFHVTRAACFGMFPAPDPAFIAPVCPLWPRGMCVEVFV